MKIRLGSYKISLSVLTANPTIELAKTYSPSEAERDWYAEWEQAGFFKPQPNSGGPTYSIVIPPPNVTGSLHMGHALNNTLQDILTRYSRMSGRNTLWQPGMDHAGIVTQFVVEKLLLKDGKTRQELGREKFLDRVWEWVDESGGVILNQLKKLGCSCDFSRSRFTMDEGLSKAVREVFVRLWEDGLIYRGRRLINWCPRCYTALSDLEVELKETSGKLYYMRYPLKDGSGHVVVATTRPETMLGDSAVAVNPEDERYSGMIGKMLNLPFVDREMPVIGASYVDMTFGTGALKITPAHDFNDYEIGLENNLEMISIFDDSAKLNENAPRKFQGMDRYDCREKIVEELESMELLEKVEDYLHSVGHCYRCQETIEPKLSDQWFIKAQPLAEPAIKAVEEGRTRIIPEMWQKTYFEWMRNIRDWCISRQLWWGHQIPAWLCEDCGEYTVSREDPDKCSKCDSSKIERDPDVLDTWFSSALWPFSTLGWPEKTPELQMFYPTSVLVTGFDILFFWVARMMMMGIKFMDDVPFREVYIHALVRDEYGKKMSKSKGNVIDPLDIIDRYGADPFRFTLASFAAQGRDIKLQEARIEGYRHFANKIWQASRFVISNISENPVLEKPSSITIEDRWILSRIGRISSQVAQAIEEFKFDEAAKTLYAFIWGEFCDWYIEMSKEAMRSGDDHKAASARYTLQASQGAILRLLHPVMPYITETIWRALNSATGQSGNVSESIVLAPYPTQEEFPADEEAETKVDKVMEVIKTLRNIRGENGIPPSTKTKASVKASTDDDLQILKALEAHVKTLAKVNELEVGLEVSKPTKCAEAIAGNYEVFIPLDGLVDFAEEIKRLKKQITKLETQIGKSGEKLKSQNYLERAPAEVVEAEKEKLNSFELEKKTAEESLHKFERML